MTYRQLVDHVMQRQRLAARGMTAPEDDWYPEIYFLRREGLHRTGIPTGWFEDRATKRVLVQERLVPIIRLGRVRAVALVVVMFSLRPDHPVGQVLCERHARGEESPTRGLPRFQDINGSEERLCVHALDAERTEGWSAPIARPPRGAPALGPFELLVGPDAMFGELIDPIREALR